MNELGLIGHPVEHSMSQLMHTAVFKKMGLDCSYDLFDIEPAGLEEFMAGAKERFKGLNATIPHKVSVIDYLDELSDEAKLIGAVNTIKFEDGKTYGFNTDGLGCVQSLREEGVDVYDKNVLILGAGGAARAIAFQCVLEKARVTLSNRKVEKHLAIELADEITEKTKTSVDVVDMDDDSLKSVLNEIDVLIHATPVGMHPNTFDSIISAENHC